MARKGMAEDEFVDLYNLIELPPDADTPTIRKRINELYLEAQQNLDHRNVKKRLQYQQMYELYLPQARHLLLDAGRRAEYDRYLQAYQTGHLPPPAPIADEDAADTSTEVSAGAASSAEVSFNFDESELETQEPVDPEKQAAEREQLWARWKTGLEHVLGDEDAPDQTADADADAYATAEYTEYDTTEYDNTEYDTNEYATAEDGSGYYAEEQPESTHFDFDATSATPATGAAPTPRTPEPRSPAPRTPAPRSSARTTARPSTAATGTANAAAPRRVAPLDPNDIDLNDPEKIKEIEHQREVRRYSLIKQTAERAGLFWGWGTGTAFFFFACLLFYLLDDYLTRTKNHPIDRSIFNALFLIGIIFLSILVGWMGSSSARQRIINDLSHLPLPDLVRRTRGK